MKEIFCLNCNKSFGLYNEKYYNEKSLAKIANQYCGLHEFYGHSIVIRDSQLSTMHQKRV
ncbi:MAG: hypothetical protein KGH89_01695 [Thaumarchaeota archaeon]|nr:hypothetical protein [Nitrososphaerota archaeon]